MSSAATPGEEPGATDEPFDDAAELELRPSSDFIDGFLAATAAMNAANAGEQSAAFFYSLEWIGDGEEDRDEAILMALQSEPSLMAIEVQPLDEWRFEAARLAAKWLAQRLPAPMGETVAAEFLEALTACLGGDDVEGFIVAPRAPDGAEAFAPVIGVDHDHMLFETPTGRLLLEFSFAG